MKPLVLSFGRRCGKMTGHGSGWKCFTCVGAGCFSKKEATTSSTGLGGTSFSSSYDGGGSSSPAAASSAHSSSSPWKSSLSDSSPSSSAACFSGGYGEVDRACGFGDLERSLSRFFFSLLCAIASAARPMPDPIPFTMRFISDAVAPQKVKTNFQLFRRLDDLRRVDCTYWNSSMTGCFAVLYRTTIVQPQPLFRFLISIRGFWSPSQPHSVRDI